jgi:hypothetical protein
MPKVYLHYDPYEQGPARSTMCWARMSPGIDLRLSAGTGWRDPDSPTIRARPLAGVPDAVDEWELEDAAAALMGSE